MLLGDLLKSVGANSKRIPVRGISFNSKKVKKGDIFFAIKGQNTSGNKFINEALAKGASAILTDKKKKYKNIRSHKMLNKVLNIINLKGFFINNIDINLISEKPKISKYRNKIISSLCDLCKINKEQINIKGKTVEKLGLIGKEKAIACEIISSVIKYD